MVGYPTSSSVSPVLYLQAAVYSLSNANAITSCLHEDSKDNKSDPGNFPMEAIDCNQFPDKDMLEAKSVDGSPKAMLLFHHSTGHALSKDPISNEIVGRVLNISRLLDSMWIVKESKTTTIQNTYRVHPLSDNDKCITQLNPVNSGSGSGIPNPAANRTRRDLGGIKIPFELRPCINEGTNTDQDFVFGLNSTVTASIANASRVLTVNL